MLAEQRGHIAAFEAPALSCVLRIRDAGGPYAQPPRLDLLPITSTISVIMIMNIIIS